MVQLYWLIREIKDHPWYVMNSMALGSKHWHVSIICSSSFLLNALQQSSRLKEMHLNKILFVWNLQVLEGFEFSSLQYGLLICYQWTPLALASRSNWTSQQWYRVNSIHMRNNLNWFIGCLLQKVYLLGVLEDF